MNFVGIGQTPTPFRLDFFGHGDVVDFNGRCTQSAATLMSAGINGGIDAIAAPSTAPLMSQP